MLSMGLGWEVTNILNGGANMMVPVNRQIMIVGYEISVGIAFPLPAYGFTEVLWTGLGCTGTPTFSGLPRSYGAPLAANDDFGPSTFDNGDNFTVQGGAGGGSGPLFSCIQKTNAPTACSEVFSTMFGAGFGIMVPAGGVLLFHADALGPKSDIEMQGVIFYE